MALDIKGYRIFIASPAGLELERKTFKDTLEEYNISEANARGAHFYPMDWKITLGGIKRPQSEINKLIRECDYLILVLYDRWGSPPDKDGKYSSGTEEEFHVALECYHNSDKLMRKIVPFFKAVSPERTTDPGTQLQKVLSFKKKLQDEKEIQYHSFGDVDEFVKYLRRHLAQWRRDHEQGESGKIVGEIPPSPILPQAEAEPVGKEDLSLAEKEMIEKAQDYADQGKLLEAEECFARALIMGNNPAAINQYGLFLVRVGRSSQATVMFERVLELADLVENPKWQAVSYGNLGIVYQKRGDLDRAEEMHRKSLEIDEKLGRLEGMASSYGNLGIVYQKRGDLDRAEEMHRKSLEIEEKLGRLEGMASEYGNLGIVYKTRGDLDKAEEMYRKSLEVDEKLGRLEGMTSGYGNLGIVYQKRGDLDRAEEMHRKSLEIDEKLGRLEGMASSYGNLGIVYQKRGDLDRAEEMYRKSLEVDEKLGRLEGMASNYGNLGIVYQKRGDLDKAEEMHRKSLEIDEKLGQLEGMASDYGNLGIVYQKRGDLDKAEEMHRKSLEIDEKLGQLEGMASDYGNLGNVCKTRGDLDKAEEYWKKAKLLFIEIGIPDKVKKVQRWLDTLKDKT